VPDDDIEHVSARADDDDFVGHSIIPAKAVSRLRRGRWLARCLMDARAHLQFSGSRKRSLGVLAALMTQQAPSSADHPRSASEKCCHLGERNFLDPRQTEPAHSVASATQPRC
jgi:hypothetical protein